MRARLVISVFAVTIFIMACGKDKATKPTEQGISLIGSCQLMDLAYEIKVEGSYAYLACNSEGLKIINILNPENPFVAGSYDTPERAIGVDVFGDYAYIVCGDSGLQIVSIANASTPDFVGAYSALDSAVSVFVRNDYAYVMDYSQGLFIIDISNPFNPILAGSFSEMGDRFQDVFVWDDYAFIAYSYGFGIIDIADPSNPTFVENDSRCGYAKTIFIYDNYAYLGCSWSLLIFDIINPSVPRLAGYYDCSPQGIFAANDYVYVVGDVGYNGGLKILDISYPANPALVDSVITSEPFDVAVARDYIYIANSTPGLQIFQYVE